MKKATATKYDAAPFMMPAEAERALREESASSRADSLERRLAESIAKLQDKYQALVRFYGTAQGPLIPRPLVPKLADPAVQRIVDWVLADFLGWCCFTSACAAFRARGDVNGRFVQALADTVCFGLSGREPAMPRDEDFRKLNTWRFAGFGKYTRFPYLFPAMQNSAVWLLAEEILWLLEGRAPDPLAIPWLTAQASKLGFDADQAFQVAMLARPLDADARKKFFAEVDRFADLMPSGR
ncbi:MAG TPA: hypothetical protein VK416_00680 [Thermoanaerobaculia bacterium]|nr:hypothetical protein [Thermoanaerobaculia bacterium]